MSYRELIFTIFSLSSCFIFYHLNRELKNTYMDEFFHLDQAISFYNSNFTYWNNKLTTFPGTFFTASLFMKFIHLLNDSIPLLMSARLFTLIISIFSFFLLGKFSSDNSTVFRLIILLLPINYFYNFLFYTDTFSTFGLILYFYFGLKEQKRSIPIFITAMLSVLMRQNNIIWVNLLPLSDGMNIIVDFVKRKNISQFMKNIMITFVDYLPIVIVDGLFVCFLKWNNFSVVLGDKSHHEMCLHFAQINHLLIFSLVIFPFINCKLFTLLKKEFYTKKKLITFFISFILILCIVFTFNKFSYVHDFILSDNRHYSFYYFRKIYNVLIIRKIILVYISIVYALVIVDNVNLLCDTKIISFCVCTTMCLIPAKLVEFRYFISIFVILLILVEHNKSNYLNFYNLLFHKIHILLYLIENCTLLYIFIKLPFKNESFGNEMSRFMF